MKHQRKAVHAVAQAGRLRPIVEEVSERTATAATMDHGRHHAESAVFGLADGILERLIETRPAGAALEFGLRGEQRQVAAGAGEDALAVFLEQRARTRALGALLAQDLILLRRQLRAPFRVGLFDLEFFRGVRGVGPQPAERGKAKQAGDGGEQDTAVNHDGLRAMRSWSFAPPNTGRANESYTDRDGNFSLCCERAAAFLSGPRPALRRRPIFSLAPLAGSRRAKLALRGLVVRALTANPEAQRLR